MKSNLAHFLLAGLMACAPVLFSQEIVSFDIINNESIGLTMAPYEKWGMAVHDIDRNGYPDIFCVRWSAPGYSRMYINTEGVFQEITPQSPLEALESVEANTRCTLWVDFDNDGDRDLSMATEKNLHLFRNDNNVFSEVSTEAGFVGYKPPGFITNWGYNMGAWADYDLDGDLDCVLTQDNNERMYLFRNDDGHFTNVSAQAGLDSTAMAKDYRLSWFDFDLDGDPDLHCRNNMYRNDGGVFTNVSAAIGFDKISGVTYRDFFDYDNDGDFDFFKVNGYPTSGDVTEIWENRDGLFINATEELGLTMPMDNYRGLTIGDFDNDGDSDVFIQNNNFQGYDLLLVNDELPSGARAFADVAQFIGVTAIEDNRKGAAFFDYNRDGFLDIYVPSMQHYHVLYKNLADNGANWIGFILEGTRSNRDAVGSLVTLYSGAKRQIRYTLCGNGFMRQDNPWVHFGIGVAASIDSVVIRWPLGLRQVITSPAINQYHEVKEPTEMHVASGSSNFSPEAFYMAQNYPNPFNPVTTISYTIDNPCEVNISVFNSQGRLIRLLVQERKNAGRYETVFQARDIPSGVYFCRMQIDKNYTVIRKMLLVR